MAKQLYYHVRTYSADGKVRTGSTYYGLNKAVEMLRCATGQKWSYQIVHRFLKDAPLWASAYVVAPSPLGPGGAYVCSIEEVPEGSSASISPYGQEAVVRLGQTALPPDHAPAVTPLDVLIEQAKQDAQLVEVVPCCLCQRPHPRPALTMGVCEACIDAPAPLVEHRCAGNFHTLPCNRLSSWQAKQYGCTCPKR